MPSIQDIEIVNVMSLLNNSNAGYDDLQPSIMKMLTKVYIKPLTYLITISIKQGIFPEELKLAKVILVYKSLWTDPAGVTALLARWTEKLAGGPQAGTSDSPPLARVMGVGRQQQSCGI